MMRLGNVRILLFYSFLCGCSGIAGDNTLFSRELDSVDPRGKPVKQASPHLDRIGRAESRRTFQGVSDAGTGTFVSAVTPFTEETNERGEKAYTLNLNKTPIDIAAQNIFSDILNANYVIDPDVSGSISLQTNVPVDRDELLEIFETALSLNRAAIIRQGDTFRIVPADQALASTPPIGVSATSLGEVGLKIQVLELKHIAAGEMQKILQPITRSNAVLQVDNRRNHLMVAGTAAELQAIQSAIQVFDVDFLRGQSVAIHPLKTTKPDAIVSELKAIFGLDGNADGEAIIRFISNERLNSVMVITSRPSYLERAERWIKKLDQIADNNEEQLFVYRIQNRPAKELAEVLQSVLVTGTTGGANSLRNRQVAPDLEEVAIRTDGATEGAPLFPGLPGRNDAFSVPNIVADDENNALLISTTAREFERIERILEQLDILPVQVLLEAIIAEVTLDDELEFGLRWAVESGRFNFGLSDLASGFAGPTFPGFSAGFTSSNVQVTLNALASITDVNVISSPNLVALNNQ